MKTKRFQQSVSLILVLAMALALPLTANATSKAAVNNIDTAAKAATASYLIADDESVIESVDFTDALGSMYSARKTVRSDGTFTAEISSNGLVLHETTGSGADYDAFINLASNAGISLEPIPDHTDGHGISPTGGEISGPQFVHVFLGSPGSRTVYKSDIDWALTQIGIVGFVFGLFGQPWSVAVDLAAIVMDIVEGMGGYYHHIDINPYTYVVNFSYGGYYTHCYHTYLYTYDQYNNMISSNVTYAQAIGG